MTTNSNLVVKSAFLYLVMRWTDRLIGFVSTLILARLLVPADFGIIAMASLVIGLVDVLLDLGVNVALIQNRNPTPAHYNTAWTLRMLQASSTVLIVWMLAPYAADYFHDPRISAVLTIASFGSLIAACENIGVVTFQKELRADLDLILTFSKRITGFIVTISIAWLLESYWALVIGTLSGRAVGVILSYRMHPMRARPSLEKFREIFGVSQWMLINSIGNYINNNVQKLLIGRIGTAAMVGSYTLADEISAMPSSEILSPINRVLFPAFVRAKHDLAELKRLFLLAQGVQCLIAIPASLGLALVAQDTVLVLLGAKWMQVVPLIQVLALSNIVQAVTSSSGYVLLALARNRSASLTAWVQAAIFIVGGTLLMVHYPDIMAIAWLRLASVSAGLVMAVWMLMHNLRNVRLREMAVNVLRPLLGVLAMGLAIYGIKHNLPMPPVATLLVTVPLGMLVYTVTVMAFWHLAGRPASAETFLLDKVLLVTRHLNKRRTRSAE